MGSRHPSANGSERLPARPQEPLLGGRASASGLVTPATGLPALVGRRPRRSTGETVHRLREALRQSEERYWALVDQSLQGVMIVAGEPPRFASVNHALAAIIGLSHEDLMRLSPAETRALIHPDDQAGVMERYRRLLHAGWRAERFAFRFRHTDETWRWVDVTASPITVDGEAAVQGVCFDVTDQRVAIEDLRRSEETYRLLAENVDDIIWTADLELDTTFVSPSDARVRGYPLEVSQDHTLQERFSPESVARLRAVLGQAMAEEMIGEAGFPLTVPLELQCADGSRLPTETTVSLARNDDGEALGFLGVTRDISRRLADEQERRELETQMQRAQQLESIGLLAGGVAHDFNNLLSSLRSNIELVRLEVGEQGTAPERLRDMEIAAQRAADLCRQLLAYAGKGRFSPAPLDLNELVNEMANLLLVSISKKATLTRHLASDLPAVVSDATQVRQVVLNLVTNASEALGSAPGTIRLRTGMCRRDAEELRRSGVGSGVHPGRYVYLEVADTGSGMAPETRERIFEPFFSTKFAGRGLGLAAVTGILRAAGGFVEVDTAPDQGTTFRVFFPASRRRPRPTPMPEQSVGTWSGSGQVVLVVDDDRLGREGLELVLQQYGFEVLVAAGGRDALALFEERQEDVAVVLLDLAMPDLDGVETFRALRQLRTDVPVILCSGYGPDEVANRFAEDGAGLAGFLAKPYEPSALLAKLRGVLESG